MVLKHVYSKATTQKIEYLEILVSSFCGFVNALLLNLSRVKMRKKVLSMWFENSFKNRSTLPGLLVARSYNTEQRLTPEISVDCRRGIYRNLLGNGPNF